MVARPCWAVVVTRHFAGDKIKAVPEGAVVRKVRV